MNERATRPARRARNNGQSGESGAVVEPQTGPRSEFQEEPQPMTHPAVVVMRIPTGEPGQERIEMLEINGIDSLSVPTLLRMAASLKEKQLNGEGR